MTFEKLKDEYSNLWATMVIRSSFKTALEASAKKIIDGKARYEAVSEMTGGVPWFVIGLIHQMEAGCKFGCHLHNGDPLSSRTVNVPAKRPASGTSPFKWEASACDALTMKKMQSIKDWSIERIAYELERYNGWGYRNYHKSVLTPYLWSGTTHYARGKYVSDGKWDPSAVSGQTGALPLLKKLMELDPSISLGPAPVEVKPEPQPTQPDSFVKANEVQISKPVVATGACAATGAAVQFVPLPSVPADITQSVSSLEAWKGIGEQLWTLKAFAGAQPILAVLVLLSCLTLWLWPRRN